jgi:acyl-CoA reductase-like NAD-dependent aldehyde dehydrogenase
MAIISSLATARRLLPLAQKCIHIRTMASLLKGPNTYINGEWVGASSKQTFEVKNPANGKVIASVPDMSSEDANSAIDAARKAFVTWQDTTVKERSVLLRKWFNLCIEHQEELAKLLTAEQGKPLAEARGEIAYSAGFLEWFAEEARRIYGEVVPAPSKGKELIFIKQPIGVAAMITPWNFPAAMITRKVGAALAAGCTCVIKPAEDTPLTALALCSLAEEAGIPKGTYYARKANEYSNDVFIRCN